MIILQTLVRNAGNTARPLRWANIHLAPGESRILEGAYPSACRNPRDEAACRADIEAGLVVLQYLTNVPTLMVSEPQVLATDAPTPATGTLVAGATIGKSIQGDGSQIPMNTPVGGETAKDARPDAPRKSLIGRAFPKQGQNENLDQPNIAQPQDPIADRIIEDADGQPGVPPRLAALGDVDSLQQTLDHLNNAKTMFGEEPSVVVEPHNTAAAHHQKAAEEAEQTTAPTTPAPAQGEKAPAAGPKQDGFNVVTAQGDGQKAIQRAGTHQPGATQVPSSQSPRRGASKKAEAMTTAAPAKGRRRRASATTSNKK